MLESPGHDGSRSNKAPTDLEKALQEGVAPWKNAISVTPHYMVFEDGFPVTTGHLLFVPQYNTDIEIMITFRAALEHGKSMQDRDACDGFNVGINWGRAAGQTVMYPHIHLIPRDIGDCADPVGGVRGVIPGQANYRSISYRLPTCE